MDVVCNDDSAYNFSFYFECILQLKNKLDKNHRNFGASSKFKKISEKFESFSGTISMNNM